MPNSFIRPLVLLALALGAAPLPTGALFAQAATAPELPLPQPGFDRLKVGKADVIALSDGTARLPLVEGFVRNAKPGELPRLLADHAEPTAISASVNAYLVKLGTRVILIDAGAAGMLGPTAGKVPLSLAAAGIRPETVTDIFITHMHVDHIGGLLVNGKRRYPNATLHIARQEVAYWSSPAEQAKAEGYRKTTFPQVAPTIKPYVDAGKLRTFDGPTVFFPGFRSEPAFGHTPGHSIYILDDAGQEMRFEGDVLNVAIQLDDPALSLIFDGDMGKAQSTRRTALEDAATKGYAVALAHMSFPGIGHIRKEGAGYRWIPLDYVNDAPAQ